MHDILPEDQPYFQRVAEVTANLVEFYGFKRIDPVILETVEVFTRGIGEVTDLGQIVAAKAPSLQRP